MTTFCFRLCLRHISARFGFAIKLGTKTMVNIRGTVHPNLTCATASCDRGAGSASLGRRSSGFNRCSSSFSLCSGYGSCSGIPLLHAFVARTCATFCCASIGSSIFTGCRNASGSWFNHTATRICTLASQAYVSLTRHHNLLWQIKSVRAAQWL